MKFYRKTKVFKITGRKDGIPDSYIGRFVIQNSFQKNCQEWSRLESRIGHMLLLDSLTNPEIIDGWTRDFRDWNTTYDSVELEQRVNIP